MQQKTNAIAKRRKQASHRKQFGNNDQTIRAMSYYQHYKLVNVRMTKLSSCLSTNGDERNQTS